MYAARTAVVVVSSRNSFLLGSCFFPEAHRDFLVPPKLGPQKDVVVPESSPSFATPVGKVCGIKIPHPFCLM